MIVNNRTASLRLVIFFGVFMAASMPAEAFIADVLTPPSTDFSVWILRQVLGSLVDEVMGSGGGQQTVMLVVIAWLLKHLIIPIGGLILLYSSYMGISHSSMSGEIFGGHKQAYWVAVRTVIAFGLVAPAPALKGLALVNLFLMSLTLHGVGGASSVWGESSDALMTTPTFGTYAQQSPALFDGLLLGELCAAAYNQYVAADGDPPGPTVALKKVSDTPTKAAWAWARGDANSGFCGEFFGEKTVADPPVIASPLQATTVTAEATKKARDTMAAAQVAAITEMQASAKQIAEAMIAADAVQGAREPTTTSYAATMNNFSQAMQTASVSAATSVLSETATAWKQAAKQDGWATSGFYFLAFGSLQSAINRTSSLDWAHVTPISAENYLSRFADETVHGWAASAWKKMDNFIINGHRAIDQSLAIERPGNAVANDDSLPFYEGNKATRWIMEEFKDMVNKNTHPLELLRGLGNFSLKLGMAVWGVEQIGGAIFAAGPSGLVVKAALSALAGNAVGGFIHLVAIGLCLMGVIFIVASLMPSLIWLTNLTRWVFSVITAQIAAPLWAVLHAHPEGEGIAGAQARAGYMLVLSLTLRPILLTVSLLISYYVMAVMGQVLNKVVFAIITGFDFGWLTPFFFILFYGAALYTIIKISLDEMSGLYVGILDWIGGGRGDPSDMSQAHGHLMAGFMALRGKMGDATRFTTPNPKDEPKSNKNAKLSRDETPKITNDHLMPKDK
jgi:conjugal transfer/type IV secretion protein DotA/TraY